MSSYGMWLSAAGMKVNDHRQTITANNMANAATVGFKHDLAVISARPVESREEAGATRFTEPVLDGLSGGVEVMQPQFTSAQGHIDRTDRPLDLAIEGEGYFTVKNGDQTRYTRNGALTMNATGQLVLATESGMWSVVDAGGAPIVVDPAGPAIQVTSDGVIRQGEEQLAKLEPVVPADGTQLRKSGETLFELRGGGAMRPASGLIIGGSLERSTFDPISGIASMIEATRAYQLNANMIQLQDELTGQAVTTIGRLA